jgi:lysophospholipase L1-like esterase
VALLLVAEGALRILGVEPMPWPALAPARSQWDDFPWVEVDPLLGPLPRPGWEGLWFDAFEVEIDERGFRATGFEPPGPGAPKIAFLGDSCSFGWGVDTSETFVARLDARQRAEAPPRFDLVNAAYPGDSAVVGYQKLRHRIARLEPALVVLGFSANNAFRWTRTPDVERFRAFEARRLALESRLVRWLAAWLANWRVDRGRTHPRDREAVDAIPLHEQRRVATAAEFERALRDSVALARDRSSRVLFLLFPRASEVSDAKIYEDPALSHRELPLPPRSPGAAASAYERALTEFSCLDPGRDDVLEVLHRELRRWRPVRPDPGPVRRALAQGAAAWVEGDLAAARRAFSEALRRQPDSPLALYDLAVVDLAEGESAAGLARLERADRLACSAFLHYQVVLRRLAAELDVPVVDLLLLFQAHDGEQLLLDSAHPTPRGHELIARALWTFLAGPTPPDA